MGEVKGYQPPAPEQQNDREAQQMRERQASTWLEANRASIPPGVYDTLKGKLGGAGMETVKESREIKTQAPAAPEAVVTAPAVAEEPKEAEADPLAEEKKLLFAKLVEGGFTGQRQIDRLITTMEGKDKGRELADFLSVLQETVWKLDPNGDSKFTDPTIWNWLKKMANDGYRLEIIYPAPGTPYSARDFEIASVHRGGGGFREKQIVKVEGVGLKRNGNVERRARIVIQS